jgi:hypothetical protein
MLSIAMQMYYDYVTEQQMLRSHSRLMADISRGIKGSALAPRLSTISKEWMNYVSFTQHEDDFRKPSEDLQVRYERIVGMSIDSPEFQERMNKTIENMRNRNA